MHRGTRAGGTSHASQLESTQVKPVSAGGHPHRSAARRVRPHAQRQRSLALRRIRGTRAQAHSSRRRSTPPSMYVAKIAFAHHTPGARAQQRGCCPRQSSAVPVGLAPPRLGLAHRRGGGLAQGPRYRPRSGHSRVRETCTRLSFQFQTRRPHASTSQSTSLYARQFITKHERRRPHSRLTLAKPPTAHRPDGPHEQLAAPSDHIQATHNPRTARALFCTPRASLKCDLGRGSFGSSVAAAAA